MKLIIQIPCFNEAENLPETLVALPRQIEGRGECRCPPLAGGGEEDLADRQNRIENFMGPPEGSKSAYLPIWDPCSTSRLSYKRPAAFTGDFLLYCAGVSHYCTKADESIILYHSLP